MAKQIIIFFLGALTAVLLTQGVSIARMIYNLSVAGAL